MPHVHPDRDPTRAVPWQGQGPTAYDSDHSLGPPRGPQGPPLSAAAPAAAPDLRKVVPMTSMTRRPQPPWWMYGGQTCPQADNDEEDQVIDLREPDPARDRR